MVLFAVIGLGIYFGYRKMQSNIINQPNRKQIEMQNIMFVLLSLVFGFCTFKFDNDFSVLCGGLFGIMYGLIYVNYSYIKEIEK